MTGFYHSNFTQLWGELASESTIAACLGVALAGVWLDNLYCSDMVTVRLITTVNGCMALQHIKIINTRYCEIIFLGRNSKGFIYAASAISVTYKL